MWSLVINAIFLHYTLCVVMLGVTIVGITAGALGVFALLRQQSLLGDAISHAALPGIACTFLITHTKNPALLVLGGSIAGFIGTLLVSLITYHTALKKDTALGIVLSVFFGLGLVLLTLIQKRPISHQAILNKFLFGNASTLLLDDIYVMGVISFLVLSILFLFWKEFKLLVFDSTFAHVVGYRIIVFDLLLTTLLVFAIVIGLQTVGVVLMSTMFIAPAAAARQWTNKLEWMVFLASLFGACSGILGAFISSCVDQLPTGPTIVVIISTWVFISICFRFLNSISKNWNFRISSKI